MENMDKWITLPKWVLIADNSLEFICPIYLPNLSAKAPKFGISMKKGFIERPYPVF